MAIDYVQPQTTERDDARADDRDDRAADGGDAAGDFPRDVDHLLGGGSADPADGADPDADAGADVDATADAGRGDGGDADAEFPRDVDVGTADPPAGDDTVETGSTATTPVETGSTATTRPADARDASGSAGGRAPTLDPTDLNVTDLSAAGVHEYVRSSTEVPVHLERRGAHTRLVVEGEADRPDPTVERVAR